MGQNRTAAMPKHKGWWLDGINNRLVAVFNGTEIFDFDGNDLAVAQNAVFAGTLSAVGITAPTGNIVATAGDVRVTAGNLRLGVVSTFGTTEPTSAVVMKAGTAPAGAVTTSGGIFTDGTTVKKIIADGTVSDVQT